MRFGAVAVAQSSGADIVTLMLGSDDAGISIHWDEQAFVSSYDQMLNEVGRSTSYSQIRRLR
jgi:hypothetical protein